MEEGGGGGGGGGGEARLSEFPTNLFWFCIFFLISMEKYENDKSDFLQTQRIKHLDKYSISIKYSYLHSSTNRKLFHAFVYVL